MVFQYLESTLHTLVVQCCYVGQTSDKISGCQERLLLKWYAYILVNPPVAEVVVVHVVDMRRMRLGGRLLRNLCQGAIRHRIHQGHSCSN